jgi:hypothetical protein
MGVEKRLVSMLAWSGVESSVGDGAAGVISKYQEFSAHSF